MNPKLFSFYLFSHHLYIYICMKLFICREQLLLFVLSFTQNSNLQNIFFIYFYLVFCFKILLFSFYNFINIIHTHLYKQNIVFIYPGVNNITKHKHQQNKNIQIHVQTDSHLHTDKYKIKVTSWSFKKILSMSCN